MWPRTVEALLGLWLVLSPWIMGHFGVDDALTANDLVCGCLIIVIALASVSRRFYRLHLLNLAVAAWLVGWAYLSGGHPNEPGHKNEILLGLLLVFFAIIPSEANEPPASWRRYYERSAGSE